MIHQADVYENENDENVDRALLGEPETKLESSQVKLVQKIFEKDAGSKGNQEPDTQQDEEIFNIFPPVSFSV
tara:strand:- start:217 stop:432 length:216 start_codon:yes stop_codon:yes gene_type:complete